MIDILKIEPSTIERNLRSKYIALYGPAKVGKTTFAAHNPNTLILAFERGTNFLAGVKVQPIERWADMKVVLRQLEKKEAKEMYECIAIDTVSEAYSLCEEYICSANGVDRISEILYGAGYGMVQREFEKCLRKITMMDYGMILIAHSQTKNVEVSSKKNGKEEVVVIEKTSPAIPDRAAKVINQMVDIIGYVKLAWNSDGTAVRTLLTRATPNVMAGTRLKYLKEEIPFTYEGVVNAINEAIDAEEKAGATIVGKKSEQTNEMPSYDEIRNEAQMLWTQLIQLDSNNGVIIRRHIKEVFGRELKLSEITEAQKDLFFLILIEMRDLMQAKKQDTEN